jgi:hypothetical protein
LIDSPLVFETSQALKRDEIWVDVFHCHTDNDNSSLFELRL